MAFHVWAEVDAGRLHPNHSADSGLERAKVKHITAASTYSIFGDTVRTCGKASTRGDGPGGPCFEDTDVFLLPTKRRSCSCTAETVSMRRSERS